MKYKVTIEFTDEFGTDFLGISASDTTKNEEERPLDEDGAIEILVEHCKTALTAIGYGEKWLNQYFK